ncbi:MAG: SRPBCC family protein, partial [Acidimicrobiia bacterium]
MRLEEKRWVERAQEEVFQYTADFSNIQEWDPGVVSSKKTTAGPVGLGAKFELEVKFGSGTIPMVYEITEFEPNTRVVLVGSGEKLDAVD